MIDRHELNERRVPMPVITLLTDFGLEDEYVGVMKGVLLSLCPGARIIDISHRVAPQQIAAGAYMLQAAYRYFPSGTIHVVVVDPGVGSARPVVALDAGNHVFIAPDNGVLTLILEETTVDRAVYLDNPRYHVTPVSYTFHGRDIFAPAAASLAGGTDLASLGSSVDPGRLQRLPLEQAGEGPAGDLYGRVIHIDRFGNLLTNIGRHQLDRYMKKMSPAVPEITIGRKVIRQIVESYAEVAPGRLAAVIGSRDVLEVAVNQGSAAVRTGAELGDTVLLGFPKGGKTAGTH